MSLTKEDIRALAKGFAPVIKDMIDAAVKPLHERIAKLESRPEMKYHGTWQQDKVYSEGAFTTDNGSLWAAKRASVGKRPGTDDSWQLAAKKGKDGRS